MYIIMYLLIALILFVTTLFIWNQAIIAYIVKKINNLGSSEDLLEHSILSIHIPKKLKKLMIICSFQSEKIMN